ncbi:hypothetical protein GE21DRAFT_1212753 [Neurospora crassa]|nr:hypothetical protein GE21DRAFT_1212753 [Neurospora crassa]
MESRSQTAGCLVSVQTYLHVLDYRPSLSLPAPAAGGNPPTVSVGSGWLLAGRMMFLKGVNVSTNKAVGKDHGCQRGKGEISAPRDSLINLSACHQHVLMVLVLLLAAFVTPLL